MKKSNEKTNAIRLLAQNKADFKVYSNLSTQAVSGPEIAELLNKSPDRVFKTLVTVGKSGQHYVFMVPVNLELDLKKAALAACEKSISMIKSKELLPLTGYVHGGCSPIGMKKQFKTIVHTSAASFQKIFFSGGKIGIQIEASLDVLKSILPIELADICE